MVLIYILTPKATSERKWKLKAIVTIDKSS